MPAVRNPRIASAHMSDSSASHGARARERYICGGRLNTGVHVTLF